MLKINRIQNQRRCLNHIIQYSKTKKSSLHQRSKQPLRSIYRNATFKNFFEVMNKARNESGSHLDYFIKTAKQYQIPLTVFCATFFATFGYSIYNYNTKKETVNTSKLTKNEEEAIDNILNAIIDASIDISSGNKVESDTEKDSTPNRKNKLWSERFKPVVNVKTSFKDIHGCDEAKQDLQDLVYFLRNPQKFREIGATLPKGVILVGPPGVGKTSLAKAVAGEAKVPFLYANGSEFDEMYVGVGAARVRELFETAKASAPCVVFLDELDAVGSKRNKSSAYPSQNQTVSQLLAELDGFNSGDGILVLGATNHKAVIDKALIRPGRFDLEVHVLPPDLEGRKSLFQLYLSKVSANAEIDYDQLAHGSPGFTGAAIKNMVNQAAIEVGLKDEHSVDMGHLWRARDRILMGSARKKINDVDTNRITAFHEAGHVLTAFYTSDADPLHKVTIIPRNNSLGHTSFLEDKEHHNWTKSQLSAKIDSLMGGKIAEEMIYGPDKVTTGAANDLQRATSIALDMVVRFGMGDGMAYRTFNNGVAGDCSNTSSCGTDSNLSTSTKILIDQEVEKILKTSYERVRNLLQKNREKLTALAENLLVRETLDKRDVTVILSGGHGSDHPWSGLSTFLDSYRSWVTNNVSRPGPQLRTAMVSPLLAQGQPGT